MIREMNERLRFLWRAHRYRWLLDPSEIQALQRRVKLGSTAVDVGAHKGAYTYWMARGVGRSGRVVAFEPQQTLALKLEKAARLMGLERVTVENLALSSASGQATLVNPDGGDGPSPGARLGRGEGASVGASVRAVSLDDYVGDHRVGPIGFIKCDAEGHELEVFRGAQGVLARDRPCLLFECETRHRPDGSVQEVFEFLTELGYVGWFLGPSGLKPVTDFDSSVHQAADPKGRNYINNFLFEPEGPVRR